MSPYQFIYFLNAGLRLQATLAFAQQIIKYMRHAIIIVALSLVSIAASLMPQHSNACAVQAPCLQLSFILFLLVRPRKS
jgi:hypothetical protein